MINWVSLIVAILLIVVLLVIPMNWVWKIIGIFIVLILGALAFYMLSRLITNRDMKMV